MKIAWIAILSIRLAVAAEEKVDFQRDVRPILSDKCFFCHGFDPETREADLRLDTPDGAYEDLGGYSAVVPGKVKESELYLRITSKKKKEVMPPPESHKVLNPEEIETLRKWIEQGAGYQEHWAYEEIKKTAKSHAMVGCASWGRREILRYRIGCAQPRTSKSAK